MENHGSIDGHTVQRIEEVKKIILQEIRNKQMEGIAIRLRVKQLQDEKKRKKSKSILFAI